MSVVLDVAVGLITIFLLFSILVSGINEWVAQVFARRGEFLRIGLQRLINDEAVYRRVLHHPLIDSLYRQRTARGKPPSYIDPANYAMALANVLLARAAASQADAPPVPPPLSVAALRESLASPALSGSPVVAALGPILDRSGNDIDTALKGIQDWFNASMDRVSGWYKSRTRNMLFMIGLVVAALCNVDTIQIYSTLNQSPALRASLAAVATSVVATGKVGDVNLAELQTRAPTMAEWTSIRPVFEAVRVDGANRLPIGWDCLGNALRTDAVGPLAQPSEAGGPGARRSDAGATTAVKSGVDAVAAASPAATTSTDAWKACAAATSRAMTHGSVADGILKIIGWLLTALAGTLGASYWFALLTKAVKIRGSGEKPTAA